jgi:hypothetical protein
VKTKEGVRKEGKHKKTKEKKNQYVKKVARGVWGIIYVCGCGRCVALVPRAVALCSIGQDGGGASRAHGVDRLILSVEESP